MRTSRVWHHAVGVWLHPLQLSLHRVKWYREDRAAKIAPSDKLLFKFVPSMSWQMVVRRREVRNRGGSVPDNARGQRAADPRTDAVLRAHPAINRLFRLARNGRVFGLSFCPSRVCLGKQDHFHNKTLKPDCFCTWDRDAIAPQLSAMARYGRDKHVLGDFRSSEHHDLSRQARDKHKTFFEDRGYGTNLPYQCVWKRALP